MDPNHHHYQQQHHSTISPVIIFPEPESSISSDRSTSSLASSSFSSSTIVPPPHLDLSIHDTKEKEEIPPINSATTSHQLHQHHLRPPLFDNNNDNNEDNDDDNNDDNNDDGNNDDNNNEDGSDDDGDHGSQQQYSFQSSTNAPLLNLPPLSSHYPSFPGTGPLQEPTARPPKPDFSNSDLSNSDTDSGSFSISHSPTPHHHHHQPNRLMPDGQGINSHSTNNNNNDLGDNDVEEVTVVVMPPPMGMLYDGHCHPMYAKGLNWNYTLAGKVASQPCPDGAEGIARWSCNNVDGSNRPSWYPHLPDMSNCSSLWVTHLVARIHSYRESVISLAEELAKGARVKKMYSGDLIRAADIVKQLVIRLESVLEEIKDDDQERRAHLIKELLNVSLIFVFLFL